MRGRNHFQRSEFWIRTVDVVAADDHVFDSFVAPLIGDIARQFIVARRPGNMRFGGKNVMLTFFLLGRRNRFELAFDFLLASRVRRREAKYRVLALGGESDWRNR